MWTTHHLVVFVLTFCCYALFHATRKTFSNVKDSMSNEWTPTSCNESYPCARPNCTWQSHDLFVSYEKAEPFLGILDTIFLFSYAVGLYVSGRLGDKFELRKVLSAGMCLSAIMVFLFGTVTEWAHLYNKVFYGSIWCLNGLIQSAGWPSVVAVMGNWFGKSSRGLVFGIWSSCASVGNIIGAVLTAALVDYGYEQAFLCTAFMLFCGGLVVFFGLVNSPSEIGLPDADQNIVASTDEESESEGLVNYSDDDLLSSPEKVSTREPIGFLKAVLLPGVIPYALAYACIKLINYAFFFWLPYYLTNNFHWSDSKADNISTWYDVGGIVGGIIFGYISDRLNKRSPVLLAMLLAAPFAIWGYQTSPNNVVVNSVLMTLVGLFIGGSSNIVSAAVTADLGKQEGIGKDTDALATVTGIIDGTGSVGAAIGQYLVAVIQTSLGWQWVFYFFILMIFITIICLLPMLIKDLKDMPSRMCLRLRLFVRHNDE